MRLLVQWAREAPQDWEEVDSAAFRELPKLQRPGGNRPPLGNAPGYLYACQVREDVWHGYDSIAVEHRLYSAGSDPLYDGMGVPDGQQLLRIRGRNDDLRDWPRGSRWERVADYFPMGPRQELGGAIAPLTRHTIYAEPDIYTTLVQAYSGDRRTVVVEVQDLSTDWPAAAEGDTRYGTWVGTPGDVDNAAANQHARATSTRSWREWGDHLPSAELDASGRLKSQRGESNRYIPLNHTRTYYHSDTVLTSTTHTGGSNPDFEHALLLTTSAAATVTTGVSTGGQLVTVATTPVAEPDDAQWTSGAGTFVVRAQFDVPSAGVDLVYGALTLNGNTGHFARVQAGVPPNVELESHPQDQAQFSGGGLHLASYTGDWAAGTNTDRFEVALAAYRTVGHGTQNLSLQLNEADDFADGDWPGAAAIAVGVAASAAWAEAGAKVDPGAVEAAGAASTGSWVSQAATATIATTVAGVAASGSWGSIASVVVAGAVSVPGVASAGTWAALDAAVAGGGSTVLGVVASGSWVAPAAAALPGAALVPGVAAAGSWVGPAAAVGPGEAVVVASLPSGAWLGLPASVVSSVLVAAGPSDAAWQTLNATVSPGAVATIAGTGAALWAAGPATVAPGPSTVSASLPGAAWTELAATVSSGAVRTVAGTASAEWAAVSASVVPGEVSAAGVLASADWSSTGAKVVPGLVPAAGVAATGVWASLDAVVGLGVVSAAGVAASGVWASLDAAVDPGAAPASGVAASGAWVGTGAKVDIGEVSALGAVATGSWASPAASAASPDPGAVAVASAATWATLAASVSVGGVTVAAGLPSATWDAPRARVVGFPTIRRPPAIEARLLATKTVTTTATAVTMAVRGRMLATRTLMADLES